VKTSVAVAAAIAIVAACGEPKTARSDAMRQDLSEMRKAIRDFRAEKHRSPKTLFELVQERYLRRIPLDPVILKADWRVVTEQAVTVNEFGGAPAAPQAPSIVDVRSAAPGTDPNGKPWSEY
jgi:general secretion pathway protein G